MTWGLFGGKIDGSCGIAPRLTDACSGKYRLQMLKSQSRSASTAAVSTGLCGAFAAYNVRTNTMRILAMALLLVSTTTFAGYDLHVTRRGFWADESGPKITFAEWKAYVRSDRQIARDIKNGEEDFLVSLSKEAFPVWYNSELGEIYTKNPGKNAIRKLIEIAKKLKAKVQGDDGELYPAQP